MKADPKSKLGAAAKTTEPKPKAAAPAVKAAEPKAKAVPKAAVKPAPKAKEPAKEAKTPPKPAAKAAPATEPKAAPKAAKPEKKPAPVKPAPKPEAPAKTAAAKPEKPVKAPAAEPKPAPPKAAKPAKTPKPKPEKPPKLAPVAAALAKPIPAKPLAVAAGRAQPLMRSPTTPVRMAPKPLAAPKPVAVEPEIVGDLHPVPAFKGKVNGAKGFVLVGAIAGAFGVKGEVRLRAFTEKRDGVISYGPLYGEDGKIILKPKSWRELKDGVAVIAPEIKTREDAETLRGVRLFVPRANLPSTDDDEFYIVDLLGCRAEALDGNVLGEICAVWNFGAGDIIEYRPPNGGPNVRVTFTRETAPLVDLPGKRVVLDPPAPEAMGK